MSKASSQHKPPAGGLILFGLRAGRMAYRSLLAVRVPGADRAGQQHRLMPGADAALLRDIGLSSYHVAWGLSHAPDPVARNSPGIAA